MNSNSESERRERAKRGRYLAAVHDDIRRKVGRAIVAAEQGYSHSGIAKLSDIGVTESTVRSWLSDVVDEYGDEAVFAKQPEGRKGPIGPSTTIERTMPYNPDDMETEAQNATESSFDATVLSIEETTAGDIYGSDANNPGREVIEVEVSAEVGEDSIVFTEVFSLPKSSASWNNPNFKLGNFMDHYDELPREGKSVVAEYNDDGYLRIQTSE